MSRFLALPAAALLASGLLLAPVQAVPTAQACCPPHAFQLAVYPPEDPDPGEWSMYSAFVGQRINYLVRVVPASGCPEHPGAVTITASATDARVKIVTPRVRPGQVGEIFVIPRYFTKPAVRTIDVTITGERNGYVSSITLREWVWRSRATAFERVEARDMLAPFLEYLAAEHPDLGIGPDTRFIKQTPVRPRMLIVKWWLFFTPEWEIGMAVHAGSWAPDDWVWVYVRHRFDTWAPSGAWLIESWDLATPIVEIVPPDAPVRGAIDETWNICPIGEECPV
jgi:hypothetical protein